MNPNVTPLLWVVWHVLHTSLPIECVQFRGSLLIDVSLSLSLGSVMLRMYVLWIHRGAAAAHKC
jgi:hypothetical protein